MRRGGFPLLTLLAFLLFPQLALGAETDQFLTWGIDLPDSADAINHYLNNEIAQFLEEKNESSQSTQSPEVLTQDLFFHLFEGLYASRFRHWLQTSDDIKRYPPDSVHWSKHLSESIYSPWTFPFFLPMARTIRVGDVYFGIDKIGHLFGFGRRYFKKYLHEREEGRDQPDSIRDVVLWGFSYERFLVGNTTDGVLSYADLEANYQGLLMAFDFCKGDNPFFKRIDNKWVITRPFDIRPYITPYLDESFNQSHFAFFKKHEVTAALRTEACPKLSSPSIQVRLARYRQTPPSTAQRIIEEHLASAGLASLEPLDLKSVCTACEGCGTTNPVTAKKN